MRPTSEADPAIGRGPRVFSQRVRFLAETWDDRSANCVDGSVLIASVLQRIGLRSFLVLVPGHAFVGFYTDADAQHAPRQHHLQVPGAPVVAVDPDRDGVLHEQDRQQDRGGLQRRQNRRKQRGRDDADAGKPALAEAERRHRDKLDRRSSREAAGVGVFGSEFRGGDHLGQYRVCPHGVV